MTSPLTLAGFQRAVDLRIGDLDVPETLFAVPTRPLPLIRTSPLTLSAETSPLMSVTLMLPEIEFDRQPRVHGRA